MNAFVKARIQSLKILLRVISFKGLNGGRGNNCFSGPMCLKNQAFVSEAGGERNILNIFETFELVHFSPLVVSCAASRANSLYLCC